MVKQDLDCLIYYFSTIKTKTKEKKTEVKSKKTFGNLYEIDIQTLSRSQFLLFKLDDLLMSFSVYFGMDIVYQTGAGIQLFTCSDWHHKLQISFTIHIRAKQNGFPFCLGVKSTFFHKQEL